MQTAATALSYRMRAELFTQLATMERAGLPADVAYGLLKLKGGDQARLVDFKKGRARHLDPASAGERSGLFTPIEAALLRAAQSSGMLAVVYLRLSERYTQKALQVATIKSKSILPGVTLLLALFIQPLPKLASHALSLESYLLGNISVLVLIAGVIYGLIYLTRRLEQAALPQRQGPPNIVFSSLPQLPIFGGRYVRGNAVRYIETLAILLEAGVSMLDALPIALRTIRNPLIRQSVAQMQPKISAGATFAQALGDTRYIRTHQLIEMARIGEASGTLPAMLLRHVDVESNELHRFDQQVVAWVPRVFYVLVAIWIAYGILKGMPHMTCVDC